MIAGTLRGRPIRAPEGRSTRPTGDRVRESLFNLLGAIPEGARILDLFAGSGALGIEALSRGAERAVFVERDARARRVLEENLESLGLADRTRILRVDAGSPAALAGEPFDLILADPPYGAVDLDDLVAAAGRALRPAGILALEHAAAAEPPGAPESLALWKSRRYGGSGVTLYVRHPEGGE